MGTARPHLHSAQDQVFSTSVPSQYIWDVLSEMKEWIYGWPGDGEGVWAVGAAAGLTRHWQIRQGSPGAVHSWPCSQ